MANNKKRIILILLIIFLGSVPSILKAELSPPQNNFKLECAQAFGGEIIKNNNVNVCRLPNGQLCITKYVDRYNGYEEYASCDNLMDRKCSKLGKSTRYEQTCCGDLVEIIEKRGFQSDCRKAPCMDGSGYHKICSNCGDGICDSRYESKCNCPTDCLNSDLGEKNQMNINSKKRINIFFRFLEWLKKFF